MRCGPASTDVPAGLQFGIFYGRHVHRGLERSGIQSEARAGSPEAGQLQGRSDPLSPAQQLLTNQTANGQILVEMWKQVGLNVQIEMKENWGQIQDPAGADARVRDWSDWARFNDPVVLDGRPARPERRSPAEDRRVDRTPR